MKLVIEDLTFSYKKDRVLTEINLQLDSQITAVIGPNGAGKSTLIKCIAGILKPKGTIRYNSKPVNQSFRAFYTEILSYLPQSIYSSAVITVFEAVLLGRLNSLSLYVSDDELERVLRILEHLGIQELAHKKLNELSGGQQQMVSLAQALIKEPEVLLLDEPLNNLDIHHQFEILNKIKEIHSTKSVITLIAMHDLNLAAKYADKIIVLNQGQVYACGKPGTVLTEELIRLVYKVKAHVLIDNQGIPLIQPFDVARW